MFRLPTRRPRAHVASPRTVDPARHAITSEFSTGLCRFVLECSCGATFDTNTIDEALEWHELHLMLAPLEDQLASIGQ